MASAAPGPPTIQAQHPRNYGVVGTTPYRLCNLGLREGYGVGVELDRGVLDVTATADALGLQAPSDMDDLLQNGRGAELLAVIKAAMAQTSAATVVPPDELSFAPLVTRPEKILCIGFNYRKHAEETGTPVPKAPPIFAKFRNALNRHEGEIKLPTDVDTQFDYETELVIVFGRECHNVTEADALEHVAGYATGNDFSARTLQMATSQFTAGKTADGFAPIGPWLAPRRRVPDPNALRLTTRVNGQIRQDWTTSDMIFNCRQLIAYVSRIMTVKPGDVLFTGTPQGVILGENIPAQQRRWLRAGDEVISELQGLGALKVTLV
ncbi:FAA hydrolase family protein [Acuticoccus sediminis]|uniref:FAA hydrolase family protein n=2 Tax=Acuticoccus sediminis TaxID=2184697 RepID=A0A8B2NP66_9HYPH|nr:FAA hydrolase family protein [Acuticoccus sediminis]